MINFKTILCLLYLSSITILPISAEQPLWNAQAILPADSKIAVRWVLPPMKKTITGRHTLKFSVGPDNSPWIGYNNRYLLNPLKQYFIELSNRYKDLVQLENGALFISTATEFGFIVKGGKAKKTPVSVLQPISLLPIPDCRMFKGADNCIYFLGLNKTTSQYELYLLKPDMIKIDALKIKTLKGYTKIFSSPKAINAVSGDGNTSYIAMGNTIVCIHPGNTSPEAIFVHPNETITQLQYNKQSGLFYSTNDKIGYVGENGHLEFFKGEQLQISLAEKTLYILSENDFGILAFDHIDDLSKMNFHFAEPASFLIPEIGLSELIILGIIALILIMLTLITVGVIRLIRRKTTTHMDTGDKAPIPYKEKDETMSKKVYVKAPKAILIVQIIIIPLFMVLGILPFFVVDKEIMIFIAIFIVIWEAICIAILLNAIKILKRIKNGKIEVVEISGLAGEEENNFAPKLRDLEALKTDGLISDEEYQEKREEMLKAKW